MKKKIGLASVRSKDDQKKKKKLQKQIKHNNKTLTLIHKQIQLLFTFEIPSLTNFKLNTKLVFTNYTKNTKKRNDP
jgi:hypothetical protein